MLSFTYSLGGSVSGPVSGAAEVLVRPNLRDARASCSADARANTELVHMRGRHPRVDPVG